MGFFLRVLVFFSFATLLHADNLSAPKERTASVAFNINPMSIILGNANLDFSFSIARNVMFVASFSGAIAHPALQGWLQNSNFAWSLGVAPGVRFNLTGDAFQNGWYFNSQIYFGYYSMRYLEYRYPPSQDPVVTSKQTRGLMMIPTISAGYTWVWESGLTLLLGAGLKYAIALPKPEQHMVLFAGIAPILDAAIGYSW